MNIPLLSGIFDLAGSIAKGLFGSAERKADVIESAFEVVSDVNSTEEARDTARATILANALRSESWLTRTWRPMVMCLIVIDLHLLIYCLLQGTFPAVLLNDLPPIVERLIDITMFGLGGYMGLRTFEKVAKEVNIGGVLKRLLDRYI